jgi:hypothetical protein
MFHAYVERFDVMGGRGNILGWEEEVNKAQGNHRMIWERERAQSSKVVFRWCKSGCKVPVTLFVVIW